MILFLTSNTLMGENYNPKNQFTENLKKELPDRALHAVFIVSNPDSFKKNDVYMEVQKSALEKEGYQFNSFLCLDHRNQKEAETILNKANFIILAGGHVPTQNYFFKNIQLKKHLSTFKGVLVGISAGSMNAAKIVYAEPEMKRDFLMDTEERFMPGLGLTDKMIIPHYNQILDRIAPRVERFEDTVIPDSAGRRFLLLLDGSYLYSKAGKEYLHGEAYCMKDGEVIKINEDDKVILLS